jgi:hypothetical protein
VFYDQFIDSPANDLVKVSLNSRQRIRAHVMLKHRIEKT